MRLDSTALTTLLSLFHWAPEARRKECRLSNHKCQTEVRVTLWKGQWVNQGYPISNNLQTFRNAGRSAATHWPEARCQMTLWPPPAVWGSRDTSARLTKEEAGGKRSRAACFVNWSPLFETQTFLLLPSFSTAASLFTPGGKISMHTEVWMQGRLYTRALKTWFRSKEKQNTNEENSCWRWFRFTVFSGG